MSPPGGGSRGVGNQPSGPGSTQELMDRLFGGDKKPPTPAEQQAQQLRDQSRQQQEIRDTSSSHTQESEGPKEAQGREGQPQQLHRGAETARAKETEMDSFLARASNQQAQRDAGRELSKPQSMTSANAQAWSVANSSQTPDLARTLIQAKQQQGQAQPQTQAQANPNAGQRTMTGQPTVVLPRVPTQGTPNTAQPNVPTLLIRYATTSSGGETAARAFSGRPMFSDQFGRQVQRLIQDQVGKSAQQNLGNQAQVAVHVRGNIIFVRDGNKTRAFKLEKDGELSELPSEDASDQPLSPEAQKLMQKVLRQKGLHARMEGGSAENLEHLKETSEGELKDAEKMLEKGEFEQLDFETRFALLLHEVLEEGKLLGKELEGDAMFPSKADWEAFFARMAKMGNEEKPSKKKMESILDMIFRGVFQKKGQGNVLVGDLKYMKAGGKEGEEKFAQVHFSDEKLMAFLLSLKPGQAIDKSLLEQYFGEELSFTEMAHLTEKLYNMASSAEKNIVFNPKSSVDLYSQARLEKNMFASRKDPKPPLLKSAGDGASEEAGGAIVAPNGFSAQIYEKLGMRELYRGKPRLYTFLVYGTFSAVILLALLYFVFRSA